MSIYHITIVAVVLVSQSLVSVTASIAGVKAGEVSSAKEASTMYMSWLSGLFSSPLPVPVSPVGDRVREAGGWTMIELMTKDSELFEQCFDPSVSGDWSRTFAELDGSTNNVRSELDEEYIAVGFSLAEEHGLGPLEWDFGQLDEELERRILWLSLISQLSTEFPSFDDVVGHTVTDTVVKDVIDRDVERTLPVELQPEIAEILYAYSLRNPIVGYTQGLNYIVSFFFQQKDSAKGPLFSNSEVFSLLSFIIEVVNFGYYDSNLSGYHSDLFRFRRFVDQNDSKKRYRIPLEVVLTDGMFTMYTRLFPFDSCVRWMDFVFLHGGRTGMLGLHLAMLELAWSAVDGAVGEADEGLEMALGGTEFRLETIRIGTLHMDALLDRANDIIAQHKSEFENEWNEILTTSTTTEMPTTTTIPKSRLDAVQARVDAIVNGRPLNSRNKPTLRGPKARRSTRMTDDDVRFDDIWPSNQGGVVREQPHNPMVAPVVGGERISLDDRRGSVTEDLNQLVQLPDPLIAAASRATAVLGGWWRDFNQVMQNHPDNAGSDPMHGYY